jgi:hypothetical protein
MPQTNKSSQSNLNSKARRYIYGQDTFQSFSEIINNVPLIEVRCAIYSSFDFLFAKSINNEFLDRLDRLMAARHDVITRRETIIRQYLGRRDLSAANDMHRLSVETGDPHDTSWSIFLAANARFHNRNTMMQKTTRIVQYWDANPPIDVAAAMEAWRTMIGPLNYIRYDDESGRELVTRVAGPRGREAYDACWHAAMRSDLVRLAALHDAGGLWLDADLAPLPASVLPELGAALHLPFTVHDLSPRFQTDIIAAMPGHEWIGEFIERCLHNVLVKRIEEPNLATGPLLATDIIRGRAFDGLGEGGTAFSRSEAGAILARGYAPAYKIKETDTRSWQTALLRRQAADSQSLTSPASTQPIRAAQPTINRSTIVQAHRLFFASPPSDDFIEAELRKPHRTLGQLGLEILRSSAFRARAEQIGILPSLSSFGRLPIQATPLYFFLHVPKTAGTSVGRTLSQMFAGFVLHHGGRDLMAMLKEEPTLLDRYLLVSGHMGFGHPLVGTTQRRKLFLAVMRDPATRVASHYDYIRARSEHALHKELSRASLLQAFISCDRFREASTNAQLRQVFGTADLAKVDSALRERNYILGRFDGLDAFLNAVQAVSGLPRPADIPRLNTAAEQANSFERARAQADYAEAVEAIIAANTAETLFLQERLPPGATLVTTGFVSGS